MSISSFTETSVCGTKEQNTPTGNEQASIGGLERSALQAATTHQTAHKPPRQATLLERLPVLAKELRIIHQTFLHASDPELASSYAAEWILDNHHVIERAIRQIEEDLSRRYHGELPKLEAGPFAGQPRVYAVARSFLQHDEAQFAADRLAHYVTAYQRQRSLTMGELWALPIMLRIVLLETLAQAAIQIVGRASGAAMIATWPGFVPHEYIASDNEIVAHVVPSLRLIDSEEWPAFFERVSPVHQVLANDPVGLYAHMDFATRNRYRDAIESLARGSGEPEAKVAQSAIDLARAASLSHNGVGAAADLTAEVGHTPDPFANLTLPREGHVGYYLVDQGRHALEQRLRFRPGLRLRLRRWLFDHATPVYLGAVGVLATLFLVAALGYATAAGGAIGLILLTALVMIIPAVTLAVELVNHAVMRMTPPRTLPKLDFAQGIPVQCRTMVVIPALIANSSDVDNLFAELEQHYLRNRDPQHNLTFALLTDFADAPEQDRPEDEALVALARRHLVALNERHPHRPFYFFHRRRLWNPSEMTWMGWERKRGKLHEFNRLLRGDHTTSYLVQLGNLAVLPLIRYVITLDADTILPRDAAHRLVGALAHPLNRAEFDPHTGKVAAGYTVLQPRTAVKPTSANRSLFTRVFGGDVGIDLYTLAVSDLYQDLFGAGIYVGKGIYDVDAFERSLAGRAPENALLSHDLFEGIHGRAGLVTDIVLYEDYPPHYLVYVLRAHRWVRGDWQLLPWLGRVVPAAHGIIPNDLALIDRWKLLDNLRRSLLAPALLVLFVAGWTLLPGAPLVWTLLGALTPGLPLLIAALRGLWQLIWSTDRPGAWRRMQNALTDGAIRWLLFLAFLPYEALLFGDAIGATLVRLYIRRRKLLQWTTAARTVRIFGDEVSATTTMLHMLPAHLLTLAIGALLISTMPGRLWVAAPLLAMWLLAWQIAYRISRPDPTEHAPLTASQRTELRRLARHTWLFYEHYVGPTDHWLPPDHYQESPRGIVAHRTSPTNVGMYLLSVLAAYDLGYVGALDLYARLRSTFDTMQRLERYRGHFLNWIDTRTLDALAPRYVSTVDSGNLAASLIALKQGCLAQLDQPLWRWERWEGLLDTLALLDNTIEALARAAGALDTPMRRYLDGFRQEVLAVRDAPEQWYPLLTRLSSEGRTALDRLLLDSVEANAAALDTELIHRCRAYSERIHHHLNDLQREIDRLQPWLARLQNPPSLFADPAAPQAIRDAWQQLCDSLPANPRIAEIAAVARAAQGRLRQLQQLLAGAEVEGEHRATAHAWCADFSGELATAAVSSAMLDGGFGDLANEADQFVSAMEFGFLFNEQREVFHIGYNVDAGLLDRNFYDLLASEARMASLVAIAKYDAPQSHWMHLGRPVTHAATGAQALLSWSGTMFEYLMPLLLLRHYRDTLLHTTCVAAVDHQIAYGQQQNTPWGISESGYYTFDAAMGYQYRAFGAPGLGFKRGLGDDLVVAPYASLLALPLRPHAVMQNLETLKEMGMWSRYGLYEAVDFTSTRLMVGQEYAIVREYMAHHQGMILLALVNFLKHDVMVERFHREPAIQSVELLLQEQIPRAAPVQFPHEEEATQRQPAAHTISAEPWRAPVNTPMPMVHYLANQRYGLLLTNAGSGYSRCDETMLTRWRADATLDEWGCWLYVQDMARDQLWSAGVQPTGVWPDHHEALYWPHMVEYLRRDHGITLRMAITVPPDETVEVRRVSLTNDSDQPRRLRVTSYGEVVLGPGGADLRHPAFGKLFVESDYVADLNALIFRRRPRSATEAPQFLAHALVLEGDQPLTRAYESDRARFLGRDGSARQPAALAPPASAEQPWLSGATGATLDPIMALGQEVELAPHSTVQLALLTITAENRQTLVAQVERYHNWSTIERAFLRARNVAEQEMRQLGITTRQLEHMQQLLSLLFYPHQALRSEPATLAANQKNQSGLWAFGISGDYPILLVEVDNEEQGEVVLEVLQAHHYWRRRGLQIDLVILNQEETNYGQALHGYIHRLIERLDSADRINQRGGIFILREDQLAEADRILLRTTAQVTLDGRRGALADQLANLLDLPAHLPPLDPLLPASEVAGELPPIPRPSDLQFDNELGGFSRDGREYVLYLHPGSDRAASTPAPWINVIANPSFGFLISESGGGYTWSENSGENRLTTWRNDPVGDWPAEALYLRDEETAEIWSPLPQPAPANAPYVVRHGAGYTVFEHHSHGLSQRTRLFVAPDAPVKVVQLRVENRTSRPRRVTATYYAEWVLGVHRDQTQLTVTPEYDDETMTLLARNPYSFDFSHRVAFLSASKAPHGLTADRTEFLGRLGSLRRPAGLARIGLGSRVHAGVDPCGVMQLHIDLAPGESEEICFLLGQGSDRAEALALAQRFHNPQQVQAAWEGVHALWSCILDSVQVETPDPAMNLLLNRWLLYQTLACRIWGRSALYQSSGAYGYRDQLQDVMALAHTRPDVAREQILRAARHQFDAGDVLHWWHPPAGRGVRTRITDDLLWLPYVTAYYVEVTGDETILNEEAPFLTGRSLGADEEERYGEFEATAECFPLYEHCRRALERGTRAGPHGIPLIGGGDWNDGMNRVGIHGRGESIWLGWFLHATLQKFATLCERLDDERAAQRYRQQAEQIRQALEYDGWDGEWYRRAYYDDGAPLGSAENRECRIDAIAQSWAVLSGAADRGRARQSMRAVEERLVRWEDRLILLFTPPLDKTPQDPGYIKGYLPGVRENGGQYTHAALWTIWAFAELGEGDLAGRLFRLINPIYRADTPEKAAQYKVEPYVISADVYSIPPHTGRGGWTWYTGSSGWMYRLGIEAILGLQRAGAALRIAPCIPTEWPGFAITYRYGHTTYAIEVANPHGVSCGVRRATLDGAPVDAAQIPLVDDGADHAIQVELGEP